MKPLPGMFADFGVDQVTIIHAEGTPDESRFDVEAHIQPDTGFFPVDAPVFEGDVIEHADPRGGLARKTASKVSVHSSVPSGMEHIEVKWGGYRRPRVASIQRLGLEGLHPEVLAAASDLFTDGHYSQAVFEALKALEQRVKHQSGLDKSGRELMTDAFRSDSPPIDVSVEAGRSGRDEQEGFRFIFMGIVQGIRNPKSHELVEQDDPQRALEYLGMTSVLFRRLDDAVDGGA